MYSFLFAVITNDHTVSGLKWHKCIILQFWTLESGHRSHWAKIKVSGRPHSFLDSLGENQLPCLFQFLEATYVPWFVAPSSIFKVSIFKSVRLWCRSPVSLLCLLVPLWLHHAHLNNSRSSTHLNTLHLITFGKSILPSKVTYLQVPSIRTRIFWEAVFLSLRFISCLHFQANIKGFCLCNCF